LYRDKILTEFHILKIEDCKDYKKMEFLKFILMIGCYQWPGNVVYLAAVGGHQPRPRAVAGVHQPPLQALK
jgi:hypothetical protein